MYGKVLSDSEIMACIIVNKIKKIANIYEGGCNFICSPLFTFNNSIHFVKGFNIPAFNNNCLLIVAVFLY